jgi:DNA-directed RNA polymerase specialized sigma24 family protein
MKKPVKLKLDKNRLVVLEIVREKLYPEEDFQQKLFPDLPSVMFNCFLKALKVNKEQQKLYRSTNERQQIENLATEILEFKNLLSQYPNTVVLMYRTYIKKFIKYKHSSSASNPEEWEDIFQEVITRLISGKIQRIRERFDFSYTNENFSKKSFFTSYLMVTVRNIYMDIVRERNVRPLTAGQLQPLEDGHEVFKDENMLSRLAITEEFKKFQMILALFYKSRAKLELCLKLKCRIPLTEKDVRLCFPGCDLEDIKLMAQDYRNLKDKKLFDAVVPIFNRNEGTENKSDTLRKWISVKVDEIASHLNRSHQSSVYTNKNLMDFVTLYYDWFNQENRNTDSQN